MTYRKQAITSEKTGKRGLRQEFVKQQASSLDQKTRQTTQRNITQRHDKTRGKEALQHSRARAWTDPLTLNRSPKKGKIFINPDLNFISTFYQGLAQALVSSLSNFFFSLTYKNIVQPSLVIFPREAKNCVLCRLQSADKPTPLPQLFRVLHLLHSATYSARVPVLYQC